MAGGISPESLHPSSSTSQEICVNDAMFPPLANGNSTGTPSNGGSAGTFGDKAWRSALLKENEDHCVTKIPYFKPQINEGKKLILSPSDFEDEIRVCEKYIVGYFVGRRIAFPDVESAVKNTWNLKGKFRLTMTSESIFIFEFDLEEDRVTALEYGSMFLSSRLFMIRPWNLFVEESIQEMKTVPVWLNLRKIPLHLWNAKGIGMIASYLGTPLLTDKHTLSRTKMNFARVCVEIEIDFDFPDSIPISFGGKDINVSVEYSWRPSKCISCATFGHSSSRCSRSKKVWVPKVNKEVLEGVDKLAVSDLVIENTTESYAAKVMGANQNVTPPTMNLMKTAIDANAVKVMGANQNVAPPTMDLMENANDYNTTAVMVTNQNVEVPPTIEGVKDAEGWTVYSSKKNKKKQQTKSGVPTRSPSFSSAGISNFQDSPGISECDTGDVLEESLKTSEEASRADEVPGVVSPNTNEQLHEETREETEKVLAKEMGETDQSSDDEVCVDNLKSMEEISKWKPMTKDQNLDSLMKFSSALGLTRGDKETEVKNIMVGIVDSFHASKPIKDLGPTNEELGRGKRTPVPKKKY